MLPFYPGLQDGHNYSKKSKYLLSFAYFQQLQRLAYKIPEKWLPEFQFRALSSVCSGGRSQELFEKMTCLKSNSTIYTFY